MTANKSIDGLSTRAAKANAANSLANKKSTPVTKKNLSPSLTPAKRPAKSSVAPKRKPAPVSVKQTKVSRPKSLKPTRPTVSSEDFAATPSTNIWDTIDLTEEVEEVDTLDFSDEEDENVEEASPKASKSKSQNVPAEDSEDTPDFLKPIKAFDFSEEEGLTEADDTVEDIKSSAKKDPNEDEDKKEDNEGSPLAENPKKSKKNQKSKKKCSKKRKIISIVSLVIVLLIIGGVVWFVLWGNDLIAKLTGGRGNVLDLLSLASETYDPLKTDENGRTNILAFGTGGYDMYGEEGGGVHDGAQLTDSIMLISFDQETGDVAMTSLPRDLKGPATCTATGKINEVYWCNGGDGDISTEEEEAAASALMTAVSSILGVDIQYFAHLNWGSIVSIVDTLGGITVTLDEDIYDYEYTGAVYDANVPYTINGAEAVGLARARHGTSSGDFSRGASQQKIIIGIKNRLLEKDLSIPDLLGLVTTLGDNLRTNFSLPEIKTLAHDLSTLNFDVMRQISLYPDYMTTATINGISYVIPSAGVGNYGAIQAYVAKQLSSDPRDYEDPTIAIYNASDTDGLAAEERVKLELKGYPITTIDNAPEGEYPSGTTIYYISSDKPGTKALLEEEYSTEVKSTDDLPATLTPDYDFIIVLND